MEIRAEEPNDIETIRQITEAAFASAEHSSQNEAEIVDTLRKAGELKISLVALDSIEIVGHIAFSRVTIDSDESKGWYGLGPISVRPDQQKKGIGHKLVREGLGRLESAGAKGCVVLGDPNYYRRFGFENDAGLHLDGVPAEYFMRLSFGTTASGLVAYHEAFSAS